jgi:arylformamidase
MNSQARSTKMIDVSVPLSPRTPIWPGAPRLELSQKKTDLGNGEEATSSTLTMIPHCGTHIDAPLHFAKGGKSVDAIPLDLLIGPCLVIEHTGDTHIAKDDLLAIGFVPTKRLLIKTKNSARLRKGELGEDFLSLLPDAIAHLMQSGVRLLGVDGLSIGPFGEMTTRNHLAFCGAGGVIIEVLDLSDVTPGKYSLLALPIKLEGVEGAPARVVLLQPKDVGNVLNVG